MSKILLSPPHKFVLKKTTAQSTCIQISLLILTIILYRNAFRTISDLPSLWNCTKHSYTMHRGEGLLLVWWGFLLANHTRWFCVFAVKSMIQSRKFSEAPVLIISLHLSEDLHLFLGTREVPASLRIAIFLVKWASCNPVYYTAPSQPLQQILDAVQSQHECRQEDSGTHLDTDIYGTHGFNHCLKIHIF